MATPDQPGGGYDSLRKAIDAAGISIWEWNVDSGAFHMDPQGYDLWRLPTSEVLTFEVLSDRIHPADRDRVRAAFNATRSIVGPFEIDFRTLIDGDIRWISARGRGNDEDISRQMMTGVFLNVTGRKQAEESNELLAGEMSHRVKNLLAVASGLAQITSRSSSSVEDMAKQLSHRLIALGRAQDLARPIPGSQKDAALLGDIFSVLLAPYDDRSAFDGRIRIAVPKLGVGEAAASALALIVHELATNSIKYGALSVAEGMLDVSGDLEGDKVRIVWTEFGGPEVAPPDNHLGYGTRLVAHTIEDMLSGTISYDWSRGGALVTIEVDSELLTH